MKFDKYNLIKAHIHTKMHNHASIEMYIVQPSIPVTIHLENSMYNIIEKEYTYKPRKECKECKDRK